MIEAEVEAIIEVIVLNPRLQIPRNLEEPWLAMDLIADHDEEEQGVALASDPGRLRDSGVPAWNFTCANPLCTVVTSKCTNIHAPLC